MKRHAVLPYLCMLLGSLSFSVMNALVASVAPAVAMLGLHRLQWLDTRAVVAHFSGVSLVFCAVALFSAEGHVPVAQLAEPTTLAMLLGVGLSATVGQLFLTKAFTV